MADRCGPALTLLALLLLSSTVEAQVIKPPAKDPAPAPTPLEIYSADLLNVYQRLDYTQKCKNIGMLGILSREGLESIKKDFSGAPVPENELSYDCAENKWIKWASGKQKAKGFYPYASTNGVLICVPRCLGKDVYVP